MSENNFVKLCGVSSIIRAIIYIGTVVSNKYTNRITKR